MVGEKKVSVDPPSKMIFNGWGYYKVLDHYEGLDKKLYQGIK